MKKKAVKKVYDTALCDECTTCPMKPSFEFIKHEGPPITRITEETELLFKPPACDDCDQPPCPNACPVKVFDVQDF